MFKSVCVMVIMCLALAVPSVFAGSDQDTHAQIEALRVRGGEGVLYELAVQAAEAGGSGA